LSAGQVTCDVAKGRGSFTVRTPVGEAVALGTRFTVRLEEKADAEPEAKEGDDVVNRKTLSALVMTVAVISGEVLVRDLASNEQLAAAGETVSVGKKTRTAEVESWSSGSLVPRLEDGSQGAPLEVRKHAVNVTVREQIAHVEVDQTFYNDTDRRLEGVFYFPLPHGATICRLAMYVGDRLMEGEIAETERARRTFEALLVQQQDPALLEWAGGNMFKMRVFPIEAKSEKRVLISYYQVLKKEHGRIRFTYPLVSDALQTHPVGEVSVNVSVSSTPKIVSTAAPGWKEAEVKSEEHAITAALTLKKTSPEKDFVLEYNVAKGEGELVVVPYWHARDGEGYFLMIFSPELRETDSEKQTASRFVFVIDKSGGMGDRHLALARKSVEHALSQLRPGDEFGIVAYDTFAQGFRPGLVKASPENVTAAGKWLGALEAMGASDLSAAWKAAAALAGKGDAQVVYVGSGLSSLTSTKTARLVADAEKALADCSVRVHCVPVGGVQDAEFLAELARKFDGTVRPVSSADDVAVGVGELMDDYAWPLYTDVGMEFLGVETDEIYPVWFPNVSAGRQLFAFGKYSRQGKARVRLTAAYKDDAYSKEFAVNLDGEPANNFVARMWANEKIRHLQDVSALADGAAADNMIQTVIQTSKRYRVMSHYTSFIVLETAEDYERFGIERRADEFGGAGGGGDLDGADAWKAEEKELKKGDALSGRKRKIARRYGGGKAPEADKSNRAAPAPEPQGKLRNAMPAETAAAKPAAPMADRKRASKATEAGDIDVLAWAREDIFPVFGSNELGKWPHRQSHSAADAMKILRDLAARFKSVSLKLGSYKLDKDGKEVLEGREWELSADLGARRFYSRRVGDDSFDVSDGKEVVRYFPLLKYAAKRQVTEADVLAMVSRLPGYVFPWADKLDREWHATVEKKGEDGLVIRLARRHRKHTYVLLHLSSEKGPVTKIEVWEQTWERSRKYYARRARTVECTEVKEVAGVKVPTVFKVRYHGRPDQVKAADERLKKAKAMLEALRRAGREAEAKKLAEKLGVLTAAAAGQVRVIRVADLKVNYEPKEDDFKVKIPKDWAVRDLGASPRSTDRRPVSSPVNPSRLVR
jgi:hypothetical protein